MASIMSKATNGTVKCYCYLVLTCNELKKDLGRSPSFKATAEDFNPLSVNKSNWSVV